MDTMKLIQGMLLIFVLTTDSFVVSFAYGAQKVQIPFFKVAGMNLIMSSLLGIAVFTGNFLSCFLPEILTSVVCTGVLAGMGIYRIFNVLFPSEKCREQSRKKKLTWTEAAVMAFALSADSLAIGIGTGLVQTGEWILVAGSFLCGILMMKAGWKIGACFAAAFKKDLSWLSGVCLMVLAAGIWWNG